MPDQQTKPIGKADVCPYCAGRKTFVADGPDGPTDRRVHQCVSCRGTGVVCLFCRLPEAECECSPQDEATCDKCGRYLYVCRCKG